VCYRLGAQPTLNSEGVLGRKNCESSVGLLRRRAQWTSSVDWVTVLETDLRLLAFEFRTCGYTKTFALTLLAPSVDLADGNAVATG
jgi:hypothetical protein